MQLFAVTFLTNKCKYSHIFLQQKVVPVKEKKLSAFYAAYLVHYV